MESVPFAGVVLCCTSIPVDLRTDLANKVTELGGIHKNDLTHEVTHLVVGDYNTPKYRHVARDRPDIKPMCVGWVDAVRDPWTRDAPIDLPALEAAWRLRTFEVHGGLPAGVGAEAEGGTGAGGQPAVERGKLLCSVTGFEEEDRQAVIATIVDNGGVYSGDLTRAVTHLIVNKPEGKKYNAALHWNVKAVSIEWLHDSVSRGMILDEAKYDPRLPPHERGKDAWVRNAAERTATILGKRLRDAAAHAAAEKANGQRKLRKTTSQKLSVQRDDLWGDILGKSAQPVAAAETALESSAKESKKDHTATTGPQKSTNSAAAPKLPQNTAAATSMADAGGGGVLSTSIFCIHGFAPERTNVLAGAVATMDGAVASSLDEMAALATSRPIPLHQHVIVPQDERPEAHPSVSDDVLLVTEFFIERCLHKRQYALSGGPSNAHTKQNPGVIGRPFPVFPIPRFDALSICTSGFTGVDLNQVDKTVRQLGAKYEERFTAQCSVLVVTALPAVRKQKLELALSWKVPVVDAKWLRACIASGTLVPVDAYLFPQLRQNPSSLVGAAVLPPLNGKPSHPDPEPTLAFTVPTLVVASPRTLHTAPPQEAEMEAPNNGEGRKARRSGDSNNIDDDLDLTAPYDTAPSHQEPSAEDHREGRDPQRASSVTAAATVTTNYPPKNGGDQSSSAAAAQQPAPQQPLINNPFRSVSPPSRPVARAPQPKQPRQPLNRVLSEIADSAAGDSDDPIDSEDGDGRAGGGKVTPAKQQQTKATTTMKRSSTTMAPMTATKAAAAAAAASTKAKQRPALSRVVSDGLAVAARPQHVPIGISIGDLMKDGGGPASRLPPENQPQQQQQLQQNQHRAASFGFGRSRSNVSGMSVPEGDVVPGPRRGDGRGGEDGDTARRLSTVAGHEGQDALDDPSILPPTQAQVQYLDPEAERIREQLMRKILGGADATAAAAVNDNAPTTTTSSDGPRKESAIAAPRPGTAEEALAEARQSVRRSSRLR